MHDSYFKLSEKLSIFFVAGKLPPLPNSLNMQGKLNAAFSLVYGSLLFIQIEKYLQRASRLSKITWWYFSEILKTNFPNI
jgi:hypothetical protein